MKQENLFEYEILQREPEPALTISGLETAEEYARLAFQGQSDLLFEDAVRKRMELPSDQRPSIEDMREMVNQVDALTNSRNELLSRLRDSYPNVCAIVDRLDGGYEPALNGGGRKPVGLSIAYEITINANRRQVAMAVGSIKSGVDKLGRLSSLSTEGLRSDCERLTEAVKRLAS